MKAVSRFILGIALWMVALPLPAIAQCNWIQLALQSFLPRAEVDEQIIASFNELTLTSFNNDFASIEKQINQQSSSVVAPEIDERLEEVLSDLYEAAEELYGVRLTPRVRVAGEDSINAFATGKQISLNSGLVVYFLRPTEYWRALELPREYQVSLSAYTNWRDDWAGVYGILAHEAAHNIMRHSSQSVVASLQELTNQHWQILNDERKEIATGKRGGVKRFLLRGLSGVLEAFESRQFQQEREAEADVVAMLLLAGAGYDSRWAYQASEKMELYTSLAGAVPENWKGVLSEALCSDHPAWQERLEIQANAFSCLQATGALCEEHNPFPLVESLENLRAYPQRASDYREETLRIVDSVPNDNTPQCEVQIRLRPKDAQLEIDGKSSEAGKVSLPLGPHVLKVSKEGFETQEKRIVVFQDVPKNVSLRLRKEK